MHSRVVAVQIFISIWSAIQLLFTLEPCMTWASAHGPNRTGFVSTTIRAGSGLGQDTEKKKKSKEKAGNIIGVVLEISWGWPLDIPGEGEEEFKKIIISRPKTKKKKLAADLVWKKELSHLKTLKKIIDSAEILLASFPWIFKGRSLARWKRPKNPGSIRETRWLFFHGAIKPVKQVTLMVTPPSWWRDHEGQFPKLAHV